MFRHGLGSLGLTNPANWLTLANLGCGCAALHAMAGASPVVERAAVLVIAAGVLDRADGWVARRLGRESRLGAQLDMLADLVSFGLAPAAIVAADGSGSALGVALGFVLAAALRLARFATAGESAGGLSTTMGGGTLAAVGWALEAHHGPALGGLLAAAGLSALMISALPYPRARRATPRATILVGGLAACFAGGGLAGAVSVAWAAVGVAYALAGPLLATRWPPPRARRAPPRAPAASSPPPAAAPPAAQDRRSA